ncbi:hypothetical protein ACFLYB_03760 [Chloroflexota bacterium]
MVVAVALLGGCAESGAMPGFVEPTTLGSSLTPAQTTPQSATAIPILTTTLPAALPPSNTQYDKVNVGHLDLQQRGDDRVTGTLTYNLSGPVFAFELNAEHLESETPYSLIYCAATEAGYKDTHCDIPGAFIAEGTTNREGTLTLEGFIYLGMNLPYPDDANYKYQECSEECGAGHGAKIWLVPSECYNPNQKIIRDEKWQPDRFLLGVNLIAYDFINY